MDSVFRRCLAIAQARVQDEALLRNEFITVKERDRFIDRTSNVRTGSLTGSSAFGPTRHPSPALTPLQFPRDHVTLHTSSGLYAVTSLHNLVLHAVVDGHMG